MSKTSDGRAYGPQLKLLTTVLPDPASVKVPPNTCTVDAGYQHQRCWRAFRGRYGDFSFPSSSLFCVVPVGV
jgi:hypothetical protein